MAISLGPSGLQLNDATHDDYADFQGGGKVLQVVQDTKTDTFSTSAAGNTAATITGLSVTITPSSTSSKILIFVSITLGGAADNHVALRILRGTTNVLIGDAAGSRTRQTFASAQTYSNWNMDTANFCVLDSPNSTSAQTYTVRVGGNGYTAIYVNRAGRDNNAANEDGRYASTITAIEIGA